MFVPQLAKTCIESHLSADRSVRLFLSNRAYLMFVQHLGALIFNARPIVIVSVFDALFSFDTLVLFDARRQ